MLWSWSNSKLFQKCQRQWYFKTIVAHHAAKDERRRDAYLLSKLQSIFAWRGSLVDHIITTRIIPALKKHQDINIEAIIRDARLLFDTQWQSAMAHRLRKVDDSELDDSNEKLAAFHSVEYKIAIKPGEENQAWDEVEQALRNLFRMADFLNKLGSANHLIAQRSLVYPLADNISVRAIPDLIAFFNNQPPMIVDWKVNFFGTYDYRQQLGTYALALTRCSPHKDFPSLQNYTATDIQLMEVQLITNILRPYALTDDDIFDIDSYIYRSAQQMLLAVGDENNNSIQPFEYPVTNDPTQCERCNFRALCWKEKELWAEWKQTSLL